MDVAISDPSSCLTQELGSGTYVFAVAHGFGRIDGEPVAPVVLGRLRGEFERRARGKGLRRAFARPKGVNHLLGSVFGRVNGYVHARSAAHDDYVTAVCSVTVALLSGDRAYLSHVGSTAAYLGRDGYVVSLTKHDAFEDARVPVLTRALGSDSRIEISFSSFPLNEGDALVLSGRPLSAAQLKEGTTGREVLVVRYAAEAARTCDPRKAARAGPFFAGTLAAILFFLLLCIH